LQQTHVEPPLLQVISYCDKNLRVAFEMGMAKKGNPGMRVRRGMLSPGRGADVRRETS
jgi:hypothetical protein